MESEIKNKPIYLKEENKKDMNRRDFLTWGLIFGGAIVEESTLGLGKKLLKNFIQERKKKYEEKLNNLERYFQGNFTIEVDAFGTNYQITTRNLLKELYEKFPETKKEYNLDDLQVYIKQKVNNGKEVPIGEYKLPNIK